MKLSRAMLLSTCLLLIVACTEDSATDNDVDRQSKRHLVLYSSLTHERVLAVADAYRDFSGITVDFLIEPADALIDLLAEKTHYPGADVLLVSNSVHLIEALEKDVLRPIDVSGADAQSNYIPNDPDGYWHGVGVSADVLVATEAYDALQSAADYASLAGPAFKDKLCLRRGSDVRSVALVGTLVASLGEREAELIVRGWRENLAQSTFDTDAELLAALKNGSCSIAVADSSALAAYLEPRPDSGLKVHFPKSTNGGTHLHPTAAAVNRHANDPEGAARFLVWLLTEDGQSALHGTGYEFAINDKLTPSALLSGWLPFDPTTVSADRAGFYHAQAQQVIERARYR